jgi:hypothetical protein
MSEKPRDIPTQHERSAGVVAVATFLGVYLLYWGLLSYLGGHGMIPEPLNSVKTAYFPVLVVAT